MAPRNINFNQSETNNSDNNERLSNLNNVSVLSANSNTPEMKKLYQEFVKTFLKVKFEKIHNSHKGQQISEKILFKECISQNVPQNEWADFIVSELKQPAKYTQYIKRDTKNIKSAKRTYK